MGRLYGRSGKFMFHKRKRPDHGETSRVTVHEVGLADQLAEPILDNQGRILVDVGILLTPTTLHMIRSWGIYSLSVYRSEVGEDSGEDPFESSAWDVELDNYFAPYKQDEEMQIIYRAFVKWESNREESRVEKSL